MDKKEQNTISRLVNGGAKYSNLNYSDMEKRPNVEAIRKLRTKPYWCEQMEGDKRE